MKRALIFAAMIATACGGEYDGGGNVGFGGAQDIGQFRRILEEGGIPGEATLDANGFFNEHYAELPAADCGHDLCPHGMLAIGRDWRTGATQTTLQIALSSPIDPATLAARPLDLVVVVDTSGSMSQDDRIGYARDGLHLLVDALAPDDRLALVSYSGAVSVHQILGPLDRQALHATVDELYAQGSTNLHDGLERGFELALAALDPERESRVVLLSDGLPTTGIIDDASIIRMAEDFIGSGIGLTTIGVGLDFNVELMRGLAERGAGNFYFLEDAEATAEVFTEELDYFATPIGLELEIEVATGAGYEIAEVIGTRLWDTEPGGGRIQMPAVFLASRSSDQPGQGRRGGGSSLFVALSPRAGAAAAPGTAATIRLRYRSPGQDEIVEQVIAADSPLAPDASPQETWLSHEAMAERYAMFNTYLGLRDATREASHDYHCARAVLETTDRALARWQIEHADPDLEADRRLIALFIGNLIEHGALGQDDLGYPPCEAPGYEYRGCDAGGTPGSLALVALAALTLLVRRRWSV
jgi:Ca-activated chloride channel homolog